MEATSLCSSILPPPSTFFKTGLRCRKRSGGRVFAAGRDSYVDESMIILRKRIHEMKMIERNYEPPAEWMEWEKRYYTCYDANICTGVGLLQSQLMNTRPSLALGMLAFIMMSVPASTVMIVLYLMEAANGVLSAIHLS